MNMNTVSLVVGGILLGTFLSTWADNHDIELQRAATAYEHCVAREYHTTPASWYAQHQEYPPCDK